MRARKAVTGGLFDAGFAALAAFGSSVYASRVFETSLLGYYSLFLTAFLAAMTVPGRLIFFPYEVAAVAREDDNRLAFVRRGIARGVPLAMASAIAGAGVAAYLSRAAGAEVVLPLAISMAIAAALSPLQDHIRRMLHVDDRSTQAALVSALQFFSVVALVFALDRSTIGRAWIPYLALAGANAASLSLGLIFVSRASGGVSESPPPFRSVARSGSWLLYISLLGPVVGLAVNALILSLTDAVTLGFAEAARQVGRPLLVVTTGLGMALRPRSFAAAQQRRRPAARRIELIAVGTTLVAGLGYTALVSFDWPLNLMQALIPKAYEIGGLVLAVCLSNIVTGIAFPTGYELIGAKKESTSAAVESIGQILRLASTGLTTLFGAFMIAASDTVLGLTRIIGYRIGVRSIYRNSDGSRATPEPRPRISPGGDIEP